MSWVINDAFSLDAAIGKMRFSPVLLLSLVFWLVCAWSYANMSTLSEDACFIAGIMVLTASFALLALAKSTQGARTRMFCAGIALACAALGCALSGALSAHRAEDMIESAEQLDSRQNISLIAISDSQESSYGLKTDCLVRLEDGSLVKIRLQTKHGEVLYYGQRLDGSIKVSRPSDTQRNTYWKKGIAAYAQVLEIDEITWAVPFAKQRARFIEAVQAKENLPWTGLFLALACGYRATFQDEALYRDFQIAGLAHIVAVSGAHLSLAIAFVSAFLSRLRVGRRKLIVASFITMGFLLFVCAFPISAFRAAFMSSLGCASFFAKRRASSQNALGLCIVVCLLIDPCTSLSISFALSALSTLGIILVSPFFMRLFHSSNQRKPVSGFMDAMKESIVLTLSASIATLPLSAAIFAQISLVAPLSNIVAGFMFAPLCVGSLLCQTLFVISGSLFCAPFLFCKGMALVFSAIVSSLAAIPHAAIPASLSSEQALAMTILSFLALWTVTKVLAHRVSGKKRTDIDQVSDAPPIKKERTVMLACGLAFALAFAGVFHLVFLRSETPYLAALDVGQGDALLLKDYSRAILIDTGNQDTQLKQQLARKGIYRLDAVFITHPDDDHCASLEVLASVVEVERIYVPASLLTCSCNKCDAFKERVEQTNVALEGVNAGDAFTTKHCQVTVLWPYVYSEEGGNQDSLCLDVRIDPDGDGAFDYRAFLAGDAESETLKKIDEKISLEEVDIFKVGHHGSAVSCDSDVLEKMQPKVALLSVGRRNRYGHPSETSLALLKQQECVIARTDEQGTITCFFEKKGIRIVSDG